MNDQSDTDQTPDFDPPGSPPPVVTFQAHPQAIGRYQVQRILGEGGFGRVYLAFDAILERQVAIKVPRPERIARPEDVESFLTEAKILTKLDHPGIVSVYDVGRADDGLCFVVSKYVEGCDLAALIGTRRFPHADSAALVAAVAEALHHAHARGLVHRDVKPANILIDASGKPLLADFGLALKDGDFGKGPSFAGTPAYMSPEQARGEGHRVDGRSDIFSLGVVFYELLTGRRPFKGDTRQELFDQIATTEARPPRQIDDTIPKELERIGLKALSRRATERFSTAKDMAEDLRIFLQANPASASPVAAPSVVGPPPASTQTATPPLTTSDSDATPIKVVPKGLRSFDEHDADFFLELLPGARDRDGLPEGLRFWKTRIEATDPDKTFKVGLIYGPSGCGKSSLVKAGLLPRLAKHVRAVYVEATPEDTELRLLRGIRKACPDLAPALGLVDSIASIRRGRVLGDGQKVLLVLDQFEQWLFSKRNEQETELIAALRQCDGEHVQAVVMVRDDFWLAASRFMRDLEIRLVEGDNSALVDLFDPRHATKVLSAFGRAYGALPERASKVTPDQNAFVEQSVADLAQDGKVISVRLSLFAEMVKGKPWTPATLKAVGGTQGVGVTFLEETFSLSSAPPEHRLHQKAAQAVLKALLPETRTDIKGEMKSEADLRNASGYANRPRDFDDLIRILDTELRLITPTDPEGVESASPVASAPGVLGSTDELGELGALTRPRSPSRFYQFTHDYLVPSLREWLTRKQRETRRGRAGLRLAERSALWNAKPENGYLPTVLEWASIRLSTRKRDWSESQWRMMRRAWRLRGLRGLGLAAVATALLITALESIHQNTLRTRDFIIARLMDQLETAETEKVPRIVEAIELWRPRTDPELRRMFAESPEGAKKKLHAGLALLPVDTFPLPFLEKRMMTATPVELMVLRKALEPHRPALTPKLWSILAATEPSEPGVLPSAGALALYDPDNPRWADLGGKVAQALVTVNPLALGSWVDILRPASPKLTAPLAALFRDKVRPESEHALATNILVDYAKDQPDLLADLLMDSEPKAYPVFFPLAEKQAAKTLPLFQAELAKKAKPTDSEAIKDGLAERKARAAVSLVKLGQADQVWPLLKHSADPRLRSLIVSWLKPSEIDAKVIASKLDGIDSKVKLTPAEGQQKMDAILFQPETSMRRALILALGTYGTEGLSAAERVPLIANLLDLYRTDPDSGIHGAAEWTLRRWKQEKAITTADAELAKLADRGDRRWFVNEQGQTFAVIDGPVEFMMGSPPTEPERNPDETLHRVRIPRRFAIATKEVSKAEWGSFVLTHPEWGINPDQLTKFTPDRDGPMLGISWFGAAAYCNWLSEQDGLDKKEWCYTPNEKGAYDGTMMIPANVHNRKGYRLPTEAEWEYACRSGTITSRSYGNSLDKLADHAWYATNSEGHAWSRGSLQPNDLGLFDMLGNLFEWCQDKEVDYKAVGLTVDNINTIRLIGENPRLLRGGTFLSLPAVVRSAVRNWFQPSIRNSYFGFRPARTCP